MTDEIGLKARDGSHEALVFLVESSFSVNVSETYNINLACRLTLGKIDGHLGPSAAPS